nr:zinc finger protein 391-like isoform X2 [Leptinotarsa decemlineata]XP_023015097.1 zinc finger protein 391-like isoform X2 [Leptinotarsa decemlineata]
MNALKEEVKEETLITLEDFPFICRICCLKRSDLRPFDEEHYLFDLFRVIRKIAANSTNSTTNLPENICNECVVKLEDISLFIDISKSNNHSTGINSTTVKKENECKDVVELTQEDEVRPTDEHQDDISLPEVPACRICLSPNGVTIFQEKPQMVQLFKDLTDIDVTHINSQNGDRICDTCSDKLEEISSFIDLLLFNNGLLENILCGNNAVETESYLDSSNVDLPTCNDVKYDIVSDEIYLKLEKEHEIIDIKEDINGIEDEAAFGRNHLSETEVDASAILPEESFQCHYCEMKFAHESYLQRHLRTHTTDKPFECEVCRKSFDTKRVMKRHMLTHMEKKPFECHYCEKSFTSKINLQGHLHIHTGDKPFECNVCQKKFGLNEILKRHLVVHSDKGQFQCHYCDKRFFYEHNLRKHTLTHTGEKPFDCNVCGIKFTLKQSMKTHMMLHRGEKLFKCQHCKKSYSRKFSLQSHLYSHMEDKPFKCNICQKKFVLNSSLKRHLVVHSDKGQFQCHNCDKQFFQKINLKRHILTRTCEKPV